MSRAAEQLLHAKNVYREALGTPREAEAYKALELVARRVQAQQHVAGGGR